MLNFDENRAGELLGISRPTTIRNPSARPLRRSAPRRARKTNLSNTLSVPERVPELSVKCQRCAGDMSKEKAAMVSFKKKTLYFCDNCFKSVFKYDENLRTVSQIWEENGRTVPFIIRSSNWHRSSYMKVKDVKSADRVEGKTQTRLSSGTCT